MLYKFASTDSFKERNRYHVLLSIYKLNLKTAHRRFGIYLAPVAASIKS